jgi:integrase
VHSGYHLVCLLTGCRPGEGSQIKLNDIDTEMFVIGNAKAGKDIHLPITPEIAFAISLAVDEVKETDWSFRDVGRYRSVPALTDPRASSSAFIPPSR